MRNLEEVQSAIQALSYDDYQRLLVWIQTESGPTISKLEKAQEGVPFSVWWQQTRGEIGELPENLDDLRMEYLRERYQL